MGIPYEEIDYSELMKYLNLTPLEGRRKFFDVCTLFKILNGMLDTPELLAEIGFRVPPRDSRCKDLFSLTFHRTNYGTNIPINRMCKIANSLIQENHNIDFFDCSYNVFCKQVKRILFP